MERTKPGKIVFLAIGRIILCCVSIFFRIGFGAYKIVIEIQNRADRKSDLILGLWRGVDVKDLAINIQRDIQRDRCYIGTQASDKDLNSNKREVVLDVCYDFGKEQYIGRHIWGGGKSESTKWGQNGGAIIELKDTNTILMRFLDSVYSDGWSLVKVK
jgi:hypothetical protein